MIIICILSLCKRGGGEGGEGGGEWEERIESQYEVELKHVSRNSIQNIYKKK